MRWAQWHGHGIAFRKEMELMFREVWMLGWIHYVSLKSHLRSWEDASFLGQRECSAPVGTWVVAALGLQ